MHAYFGDFKTSIRQISSPKFMTNKALGIKCRNKCYEAMLTGFSSSYC